MVATEGKRLPELGLVALARGRAAASRVDLPLTGQQPAETGSVADAGANRASLVEMASGLALLANGGKGIVPHLLTGEGAGRSDATLELPEAAGLAFVASRKDGSLWMVESLVDNRTTTAARENKPLTEAGAEEKALRGDYQHLLLGLWPADRPRLVVAMVVNHAERDPQQPSRLGGKMAQGISAMLAGCQLAKKQPPQAIEPMRQKLRKQWLAKYGGGAGNELLELADEEGTPEESAAVRMPDVKGYSLRKALQELQLYGFRVKVNGSGWVTAQKPAPGSVVKNKECRLSLRMERSDLIRNIMVQ